MKRCAAAARTLPASRRFFVRSDSASLFVAFVSASCPFVLSFSPSPFSLSLSPLHTLSADTDDT